ncbi:MAG: GH92 family glycosyl hydrolase [Anaerococcus prevotii]|nr:GH92 family glycosyl hydrolase [Anaerococcus prevotii]
MKIIDEILKDIRYTDTRIGTASVRDFSNGNTLPLCGLPHGNNYLTLETRDDGSFFFHPEDEDLLAFRISHQPSPWMGDFSYINILPFTDDENISYDIEKSLFRPNFLNTWYKNGASVLASMMDLGGVIKSCGNSSFKIFAKGLSLEKVGGFLEGFVSNYAACEDNNLKMYIRIGLSNEFEFSFEKGCYYVKTSSEDLSLKFATSFISTDQVRYNYDKIPDDLETIIEESKNAWDEYFGIFQIEDTDYEDNFQKFTHYKKIDKIKFFYHAVYRAFLFPMKFFEQDKGKQDIYYDTHSKSVKRGKFYTNIGFWDGQKTLFPLLSLVAKDDLSDILEGILNFYRDTGYLPKWLSPDERGLMPGTLVENVIADALTKGIAIDKKGIFLKALLDAAEKEAEDDRYGRFKAKTYRKLGYVPSDFNESVNQTLDNSLADFSIGRVAELCGKEDLAEKYYSYSRNWEKLFDYETKFLRAKNREGKFVEDFDPLSWGSPYTEGSAFQNSYNCYHDFPRLIELFGGEDKFEERLDQMINADSSYHVGSYGYDIHEMSEMHDAHFGQFAISNQPSFHLPYLYNLVGKYWKSELIVKTLMRDYFSYNFRGFPGDEDNGSMASWFILSAMGIYPIAPASGFYELGISLFDKMKVKLSSGNTIEIRTSDNYPHKNFVKDIKVDGKILEGKRISHEDLIRSREIVFSLNMVPKRGDYEK